jgi:hypothetical protein
MNWHYGNPTVENNYLCCVKIYDYPTDLFWYEGKGEWGRN